MNANEQQWRRLLDLLDVALELDTSARANWLAQQSDLDTDTKSALQGLFEQHDALQSDDFLARPLTLIETLSDALMATLDPPLLDASGSIVGPYRLIRELGVGGMARVWLAQRADGQLDRPVALKLPHTGPGQPELIARFARERDILASLDHPHIAPLYDAGATPLGQPFLALQYVQGVPITDYCNTQRLSVAARLQLFRQVLDAVQYAHTRLVIHRDIKPSNILVTPQGDVRLLDFGIAKLLDAGSGNAAAALTEVGQRAATPDYAAPEQISGGAITTATDVYALGVVLYELLTGQRPYQLKRNSRGALEDAILDVAPRRPSQTNMATTANAAGAHDPSGAQRNGAMAPLARMARAELDTIVLTALKKLPEERYATVNAFAADIDNYLAGRPVTARPDTRWYAARKFIARNAALVIGTSTAFVILAALLGVALWQAEQARLNAQRAQTEAAIATATQTFLENIFHANAMAQDDPLKAQHTTARELLDMSAKRIERDLKFAPEARLHTLKMLADTYTELGESEQALLLSRERVAQAKQTYGADDVHVADALLDVSESLQSANANRQRPEILAEAQRILELHQDHDSATRGRLLVQLAQVNEEPNLAAALRYLDQAIALYRHSSYRDKGQTLDLVRALDWKGGFLNIHTTNHRGAEAALAEAASLCEQLGTPCANDTCQIYAYLADVRFAMGEIRMAEANYRRAFALALARSGAVHSDTIQTEWRLGFMLFETGRTTEGLGVLRSALGRAIRGKGESDGFHVPFVRRVYAHALMQMGSIEAGLAAAQTATASYRKSRPASLRMAQYLDGEAYGLALLGKDAAAQTRVREATTMLAHVPRNDPDLREHTRYEVDALLARNSASEAAALVARAGFSEHLPQQLSHTALREVLTVARSAQANGDQTRAMHIANDLRTHIANDVNRAYFAADEADAGLIEGKALLALHRAAEAAPLLRAAVHLYFALYDRTLSPVLADAQVALANCDLALGNRAAARGLLAQAERIDARHKTLAMQYTQPLRRLRARLQ